jgi:hypothetical protein
VGGPERDAELAEEMMRRAMTAMRLVLVLAVCGVIGAPRSAS